MPVNQKETTARWVILYFPYVEDTWHAPPAFIHRPANPLQIHTQFRNLFRMPIMSPNLGKRVDVALNPAKLGNAN